MPKLAPTFDNVAILRDKADEISKGGIIIPETAKKGKAMRGVIVEVGPGKTGPDAAKMSLRKGQRVCFGAFSGHDVEVDGKTYAIMPESEVLLVLGE